MTEIVLGKDSIRILQTEQLTDKTVVFVEVDTGYLPSNRAKQYMEIVREGIKDVVGPAKVVVHSSKIKIQFMVAQTSEEANNIEAAYDEAMKVV